MLTIYQTATASIREQIDIYLDLARSTEGLTRLTKEALATPQAAALFAAGIQAEIPDGCEDVPSFLISERARKAAVNFNIETAVCAGVYSTVRSHAESLYDEAEKGTRGFTSIDPVFLRKEPFLLPIFQNALNVSKAQLKKQVGSVSDNTISAPAAEKLATLLSSAKPAAFARAAVLQRTEITLEGIVRDLVGRILLEEVVAQALIDEQVDFLRESEYSAITGVVYDFRADFVLPNEKNPLAFIEVRKSSSRHASLYAKDKMFSAINWKGRHKGIIGVVVVEGEWTQATLLIMAKIFDYVIPLAKSAELAQILKRVQDGDKSALRWIIDFSITASPDFAAPE